MKKLRITVNGISYDVEVEVLEDDEEIGYGFAATHVRPQPPPPSPPPPVAVSPPGGAAATDSKTLTSPVPGVVRDIKVKPGESVKELTPLLVIETMKMETIISSPVEGKIKSIEVEINQDVKLGQVLVTFV